MLPLKDRNALICSHMDLAKSLARSKKKYLSHVSLEDLESAAYLGLVEAAARYKEGTVPFGGFATFRIRGAIQDYLRGFGIGTRSSNSRGFLKLHSIDVPGESGDTLAGSIPAREDQDARETFDDIVHDLPERGKDIFRMHFLEGKKVCEIAREMDVDPTRVSQLITQYRRKLRAA